MLKFKHYQKPIGKIRFKVYSTQLNPSVGSIIKEIKNYNFSNNDYENINKTIVVYNNDDIVCATSFNNDYALYWMGKASEYWHLPIKNVIMEYRTQNRITFKIYIKNNLSFIDKIISFIKGE